MKFLTMMAAASIAAVSAAPAHALTVRLISGGSTVTVVDGGANDFDSTANNQILFSGGIGAFDTNLVTSLSTSPAGGGVLPLIRVSNTVASNSGGTLTIQVWDDGFVADPAPGYVSMITAGLTPNPTDEGEASAAFRGAVNDSNTTLSGGVLAFEDAIGPVSITEAMGGTKEAGDVIASLSTPFALAGEIVLTHAEAAGSEVDLNVTLTPVPAPAALPLFAAALGLMGLLGRRGRAQA